MNVKDQEEYKEIHEQIYNLKGLFANPMRTGDLEKIENDINSLSDGKEKERLKKMFTDVSLKNEQNKATRDKLQNEAVIQCQKALEKASKIEKKRTDSPFDSFVQVNKKSIDSLVLLARKDSMALALFFFMLNKMDNYNALICSYAVFMEVFNCSRMTISRAIKTLKEMKYIDIVKSGTSNIYILNKQLVWNSWGTNYDYCSFGANIVVTSSENEELIKKMNNTKVQRTNLVKEKK